MTLIIIKRFISIAMVLSGFNPYERPSNTQELIPYNTVFEIRPQRVFQKHQFMELYILSLNFRT